MRNGIAIILVILLASGTWLVRRSFPKSGDPLEESHASAMDANSQPAVPATPAPSDTKAPDVTTSAPPPPADPQPADLAPQTIPITDATNVVRETYVVTNATEVPNLLNNDAKYREEPAIFYRMRLGYDRTQFGRPGNTWHMGAQFNVRPQAWYGQSPSTLETILIPDITAEIGHTGLATTTGSKRTDTSGDGVITDLNLFWPWLNWAAVDDDASRTNSPPHKKFSFGPTAYGAFQELTSIDNAHPEWVRYGGLRFMFKHDAYVDYTFGRTDGLPGYRHQVTAEFPIYQKEGSDMRYVVRGFWNTDYSSSHDDVYGISVLAEFPFDALVHPSKFRDLVPFLK